MSGGARCAPAFRHVPAAAPVAGGYTRTRSTSAGGGNGRARSASAGSPTARAKSREPAVSGRSPPSPFRCGQPKVTFRDGAGSSNPSSPVFGRARSLPAAVRPRSYSAPSASPSGVAAAPKGSSKQLARKQAVGKPVAASPRPTPSSRKSSIAGVAAGAAAAASSAAASSSAAGGKRPGRPQSAPTLLRGSGLIAQRPYEDSLLQEIEDGTVRMVRQTLQREKLVTMDKIGAVDNFADPSLYDLKIWHNSGQRAKTAKARYQRLTTSASERRRRVSNSGIVVCTAGVPRRSPEETKAIGDVRELCSQLRTNISHHCNRIGLPAENMIGVPTDKPGQHVRSTIVSPLRDLFQQFVAGRPEGQAQDMFGDQEDTGDPE